MFYNNYDKTIFNLPLNRWDTSKVLEMKQMFYNSKFFNQDLSKWCVSKITLEPQEFKDFTTSWVTTNRVPVWGICP
ncbi:BspA family leucine-rich repeat surface protein [Aliarcobacter cryaerophilus]|uniref:BspA family leucine-rich repeat surface protein n=4 Tax=unclassified Arcobacter TaxID=2593671 RepID=A0AA96DIS3_9BACT|nr:BspA family leucine-rich repeat surface protein [Arcobacter sp. AZ-2023]